MLYAVRNEQGRTGFIDRVGRIRIGFEFDGGYESEDGYLRVVKGDRFGLLTEDGRLISQFQWNFISHCFVDGRVGVTAHQGGGDDSRMGCLDQTGQLVVPLDFRELSWFSCGRCGATLPDKKRIVIDRDGNEVFHYEFNGTFPGYSEDRLRVQQNQIDWTRYKSLERYGFVDLDGILRVPATLSYATHFEQGLSCVVTEDDLVQAIDPDGNIVFTLDSDIYGAPSRFSEGRSIVPSWKTELQGVIDTEGRLVVPPIIVDTHCEVFNEGLLTVCDASQRWGYMDTEGDMVIPFRFHWAESFVHGHAMVCIESEDGSKGLIDRTGEFVIEPEYQTMGHRGDGVWHATRSDGTEVLLTDEGVTLWEAR